MNHIIIVESPAKARTLKKFLGAKYNVKASMGHIRDLPSKDGSVKPDEDFAMTWEVDPRALLQVVRYWSYNPSIFSSIFFSLSRISQPGGCSYLYHKAPIFLFVSRINLFRLLTKKISSITSTVYDYLTCPLLTIKHIMRPY